MHTGDPDRAGGGKVVIGGVSRSEASAPVALLSLARLGPLRHWKSRAERASHMS